jgi:hypothetical protein
MRMVAPGGSASRNSPHVRRPGAAAGRCISCGPGITLAAAIIMGVSASAQVAPAPQPQAPGPQQQAPAPQQPAAPAAPQQSAPVVPPPVVPPAPAGARTFTAPTGVIFNVVRPERVVDFEMVIGYLQAALEKSANAKVREQARGWRMFKSAEPGPNGTVLYVFLMDPAVPGADYALGPILSDAFPDQIEQIWKLYQGALAGGGSLLNLTPVKPPALPAPGTPPAAAPAPETRPGPPPAGEINKN